MLPVVERHPHLAQALSALERGQGAEAADLLSRLVRDPRLARAEAAAIRAALAEAWLQQDDLPRAAEALGRPPDELRERLEPALLSNLWRLQARLATARGEPSRAIALLGRALKHAARAHDSRAIGRAHYELALCYRQVGDAAIVREHLNKAAPALHAAGDRRHLALVHSLSGITFAQEGRFDEAMAALRQGERLAALAGADDVAATICGNQANVALMQHRYEQALALADRAVSLQEQVGSPHGLAVALASLGQICVKVGNLERADQVLNRALDIPSPTQFRRETRGAVLDTLAQIHLIRGHCEATSQCLRQAREAYGQYGLQTSRWYEWSIRGLEARVALRAGRLLEALALADEIAQAVAAPPGEALQAGLVAAEALIAADRLAEAGERLAELARRIQPPSMPGLWGELLRIRGEWHTRHGRASEAYHDLSQSVSVFELLGERYQAGLSQLALGSLAGGAGARSRARKHLSEAAAIFEALGAKPDLQKAREAAVSIPLTATGEFVGPQVDGDDAVVRRLVDAAGIPDLLGREGATAMLESCDGEAAVIFVEAPGADPRVVAFAGCESHTARALAGAAARGASYDGGMLVEQVGHDEDGPRFALVTGSRTFSGGLAQRFRTICAVVRQGFELARARARERGPDTPAAAAERSLEPLLPVGETRPSRVDVRVIAVTNADLEQRVAEGRFREDLFYRLSVIRIHVPPLRDRREEIPHLSTFFLREACERLGKPDVRLAAETLDLFDAFAWPGNVRQLRNEIHRAVAMTVPGGSILPDHLSAPLALLAGTSGTARRSPRRQSLASAVEALERQMIRSVLEESQGNISECARLLGLTRRGLYLKLERLGIAARA